MEYPYTFTFRYFSKRRPIATTGYMAPVARGLADAFRVYEPFQRSSGDEPLTVARHVADLQSLVERIGADCACRAPALVGHSWGAMLVLAYAAAHPGHLTALVLVGCGTFDPAARAWMRATVDERMDDELRSRLERLPEEIPDPDERLSLTGELLLPLYSHELFSPPVLRSRPMHAPTERAGMI